MAQLLAHCRDAAKNETGGVFIGRYSRDLSMAFVTEVVFAPIDSKQGPTWFERGVEGLTQKLRLSWRSTGTFYLGEWHFHPGAAPNPSSVDSSQMAAIAKSPLYTCPEPILMIIGGSDRQWSVAVYVYDKGEKRHALTSYNNEEGEQHGGAGDSTSHGR
jgi:integrative and conjugative element protein (TIGR02256 family)